MQFNIHCYWAKNYTVGRCSEQLNGSTPPILLEMTTLLKEHVRGVYDIYIGDKEERNECIEKFIGDSHLV